MLAILGRIIGAFKWIPLWAVTNHVGVIACGIYLLCGDGLMFRFYSWIWPLTACLLAKPGAQFLFQHYFGLFTKFKIPEIVYIITPFIVIAIVWLGYLNKKYSLWFFLFSLGSVFATSVIVLLDTYLGKGPKLHDDRIFLYYIAIAICLSSLSWLVTKFLLNLRQQLLQQKKEKQLRDNFHAVDGYKTLRFFDLEQYILDGKKEPGQLLKEIDDHLDLVGINDTSNKNRQLTTMVPFKKAIEFRTTKIVFNSINQFVVPCFQAFNITQVLTKIDSHDNMGWDFTAEYLSLMKQAIFNGIENLTQDNKQIEG